MTKEELIKSLSELWLAKRFLEAMENEQKVIHELYDPTLKLFGSPPLWPKNFTDQTFLQIEVELVLMDATVNLARERIASAERLVRDLALYIKVGDLYRRLEQTPPLFKGKTISDEFERSLNDAKAAFEEVPLLRAEFNYHVTSIKSLLP